MRKQIALVCCMVLGIIPSVALGDESAGSHARFGIKVSEKAELGVPWLHNKDKGWDRKALLKLKEQDPERFRQVIEERRKSIKERLEYLRQQNPQEYERTVQQIRFRRRQRLERLRAEDPEAFEKLLQRRKARFSERLEKAKLENPKLYERIMRHREREEGFARDSQESLLGGGVKENNVSAQSSEVGHTYSLEQDSGAAKEEEWFGNDRHTSGRTRGRR